MPGSSRSALAVLVCCALAACGRDAAVPSKPDTDPALISVLADPLMVDPDLSSQNLGASAIAVGGPPVAELPPVERSPTAVEDAREEARRLAGGVLKSAPEPEDGEAAQVAGVTAAQIAAAVAGVGPACAGKAEYGMSWSLSLPAPLMIYPSGHLREAAGTDQGGCRMRVVSFLTPAETGDVLDFYYTRLSSAGLGTRHMLSDGVHVLEGGKRGFAYAVRVRKLENGLSRVDLVSNGA